MNLTSRRIISGMAALVLGVGALTAAERIGISKRVPWTTSKIKGAPDPPPPYRTVRIYSQLNFDQPVDLVRIPGTKWNCIVERKGKIHLFQEEQDQEADQLFLDGAREIEGLNAAYGLAFHPRYPQVRECFVCYILEPKLPKGTRVSRFRLTNDNPPKIDASSETILLEWLSGGHNGGCLKFGPDGFLYVSTGDGSPPSPPDVHDTGQDVGDFLASILRIDVDRKTNGKPYAIPSDNPFLADENARPEVWAYGLRNPWRMSFDRATGDLWVGDVGWQLWEMVHRIEKGGNDGWSVMEGSQQVRPQAKRGPTPILPPVVAHPRSDAASVTGGYVYRGKRLKDLIGAYVYADYVTGKFWSLRLDDKQSPTVRELADTTHAVISFHETPAGELIFMDYNTGSLHELAPRKAVAIQANFPRKLSDTGLFASVKEHRVAPG
ncbi:MAG: PQQ-dependent sugar dehydrogenase, partial [Planctomycetales bacterium]